MIERAEIIRVLASSPVDLVRSVLKQGEEIVSRSDPKHSDVPTLRGAEVAAVYYNLRVAGDFYEFLRVGSSRVLFGLLDLAGRRETLARSSLPRRALFELWRPNFLRTTILMKPKP
jgi:hypothetical protein